MNYIKRLNEEVGKGFTKSYLEQRIGLPKNTLASYLTGVKKMTAANEALTIKFLSENPVLDILDMPKRTRKPKSEKPTTTVQILQQVAKNMGRELVAVESPKWDFSEVVFLNVEDFTEYPKINCPTKGFERSEYLIKKKKADDEIRAAFKKYQSTKK